MSDIWLESLQTATPQESYDLAIKLARVAVKMTQPDAQVRTRLRAAYLEVQRKKCMKNYQAKRIQMDKCQINYSPVFIVLSFKIFC